MDEEKKKKRNKKKKSKQPKALEDTAIDVPETASVDGIHMSNGQSDHNRVSYCSYAGKSDPVASSDVILNGIHPNNAECAILAETEKEKWFEKEATLENTIKQLQGQNDLHIQKAAGLEMKVIQLQSEKDSWLQIEATLQDKISQLIDEKSSLELKGISLLETVHHFEEEKKNWIIEQHSIRETILGLNDEVSRLRAQVLELDESRDSLLQENKQLMENASDLQSQIQNLEQTISSTCSSADEVTKDLNSQVDAACALVEKLITENAELVEKVNELYIGRHQGTANAKPSSAMDFDKKIGSVDTANCYKEYEAAGVTSVSAPNESSESFSIKHDSSGSEDEELKQTSKLTNPLVHEEAGEIVQVPLEENDVQDVQQQAPDSDEKAVVPISDAPLIGAPFRLISFMASYVSGADLVDRSSLH